MNILMVAPEQIPVPGNGSVEICMLAIAKQLAKTENVTIVSRQSTGLQPLSKLGNLTIVRVPGGSSQTYLSSVLHYIEDKQYDLIQVDNRPHYMASIKQAKPDTPVTLFLHSLTFVPASKAVSRSLTFSDCIVVNSDSLKRRIAQRFPQVAHKLERIHLGVDIEAFTPSSERGRRKFFHVLFAGRVIPRKGVPVIVRAMSMVRKQVPHAKLIIVGTGKASYLKELKALAKLHNVDVEFKGRVSHKNMGMMYRTADCFVCPSQQHEAFGLVNVEALSSGLPIVASNIGGIKEIVKHDSNGYLVNPYTKFEAHAKWLISLAMNKKVADKLAKQARKDAVERFSWKRTVANLIKVYKRISAG
ncbi:glycosyltransferase family 4 protein [Paenibacillus sp. SC116]|uniref:glycosyltransferase family 4 protein n=1 Tax=Paenibacillus sp. SC116 TaxID=2968986 RepID=UPI00215B45DC|nr:glycosyltransferase family 4 protein [Paenibacillus sp. SC116]MCR8846082.1 glycosyltransferase family 4 protein [Paenibacillus sp. SC116]